MWFWMFWWAFDDHLAAALNTPALGQLPIWVPLLLGAALGVRVSYVPDGVKKIVIR